MPTSPPQEPAWIVQTDCTPPRRRRALLVDTDGPTVAVVRHRLAQAGLVVDVAETGPDALDVALRVRPDVVVAASRLPGMDGFRLFTRLGEEFEAPPPVVLVFWPGNAAAVATALEAGVADAIVRPLELVEAVARIRRFVPA